ncbi:tail fiber domain-containing protein [Oceanobacillus salinisoli]|uniref:tail fiber domain-containing protein n=1 Tax=Oceanobacillus salinisoli TaxID=2678611 RepID=UPI0012E10A47|nr:tail fiber domain-containing protein [Oceanobacillus salinisoli]
MERRNFIVNFLLWLLSFFYGYKIGNWDQSNSDPIEDSNGETIPRKLESVSEDLSETMEDIKTRGINVKYPPAPLVGAKVDGVTDDTQAIRAALELAETYKTKVIIPGISVITGEIEIKAPMVIEGVGSGTGYGNDLREYRQISGFLVKGTGKKRVLTRRKHRKNAFSSQDDPISVALNIQAENVVLKDFTVFLDFDKKNNSRTNYGAKWDIGIFVGCRTHFYAENVHVLGYFREAGFYFDVTHATNLPRFMDLNGNTYDNTNNISGGDGCTLVKCYTRGAKWGVHVAGVLPGDHETYYDELSGKRVPDWRGSFGFSDFTMYSCSIYGTDHHSNYRRKAASGDYLSDTAGGAMYINARANNANQTVQGMRFFSCRFASFEPYRVRLDQANRVMFYGCHIEKRSGIKAKNPDGSEVKFDHNDTYGVITCTTRTNNVYATGMTGNLSKAFIPSSVQFDNFAPIGDADGNKTTRMIHASGFGAISGELGLRSADKTSPVRFYHGDSDAALIDNSGLKFLEAIENPIIASTSGDLNLSSATDSFIRFRSGLDTVAYLDRAALKPAKDNKVNLGSSSQRFNQIYTSTGIINTSDRNAKREIKPITDQVLDAWSEVEYSQFRFKDAVKEKGRKARIHFGLIAQEIDEVFQRHGLNAFDYGILCYEEWEDEFEEVTEEKNMIDKETAAKASTAKMKKIRSAGSLYSIRPDECLMLEAALMRRTQKRLEDRFSELEK